MWKSVSFQVCTTVYAKRKGSAMYLGSSVIISATIKTMLCKAIHHIVLILYITHARIDNKICFYRVFFCILLAQERP